jgi:hypothetical protein
MELCGESRPPEDMPGDKGLRAPLMPPPFNMLPPEEKPSWPKFTFDGIVRSLIAGCC